MLWVLDSKSNSFRKKDSLWKHKHESISVSIPKWWIMSIAKKTLFRTCTLQHKQHLIISIHKLRWVILSPISISNIIILYSMMVWYNHQTSKVVSHTQDRITIKVISLLDRDKRNSNWVHSLWLSLLKNMVTIRWHSHSPTHSSQDSIIMQLSNHQTISNSISINTNTSSSNCR